MPESPAVEDARRFCLDCTGETGKLTLRVCPAQQKRKAVRLAGRRASRAMNRCREERRQLARYTVSARWTRLFRNGPKKLRVTFYRDTADLAFIWTEVLYALSWHSSGQDPRILRVDAAEAAKRLWGSAVAGGLATAGALASSEWWGLLRSRLKGHPKLRSAVRRFERAAEGEAT